MDNNINEAKAVIEAVLFTMGESVSLSSLQAACGHDRETTRKLVQSLADDYNDKGRGMKIIELDGSYQMCTKPEYYEALIRVASQPRRNNLTDTLLETLSIIAYRQPVTKQTIENIRGVRSDHAVNKLVEYGLVEEKGRVNAPGRPILFGTTEEFLRCFGMSSINELPSLDPSLYDISGTEAENNTQTD